MSNVCPLTQHRIWIPCNSWIYLSESALPIAPCSSVSPDCPNLCSLTQTCLQIEKINTTYFMLNQNPKNRAAYLHNFKLSITILIATKSNLHKEGNYTYIPQSVANRCFNCLDSLWLTMCHFPCQSRIMHVHESMQRMCVMQTQEVPFNVSTTDRHHAISSTICLWAISIWTFGNLAREWSRGTIHLFASCRSAACQVYSMFHQVDLIYIWFKASFCWLCTIFSLTGHLT